MDFYSDFSKHDKTCTPLEDEDKKLLFKYYIQDQKGISYGSKKYMSLHNGKVNAIWNNLLTGNTCMLKMTKGVTVRELGNF